MGKKSRDKGYRFENECRLLFQAHDIPCIRVPLSGGGSIKDDLLIYPDTVNQIRAECKIRAEGFKTLYGYLTEADIAIIRADRKEALVVMPLKEYLHLLTGKKVQTTEK